MNKFKNVVPFNIDAFHNGADVFCGGVQFPVEILKVDLSIDPPIVGLLDIGQPKLLLCAWDANGEGPHGSLHHPSMDPQIDWEAVSDKYNILEVYDSGVARLMPYEYAEDTDCCYHLSVFSSFYEGLYMHPEFGESRVIERPKK